MLKSDLILKKGKGLGRQPAVSGGKLKGETRPGEISGQGNQDRRNGWCNLQQRRNFNSRRKNWLKKKKKGKRGRSSNVVA